MIFPISSIPKQSFSKGGLRFGANRAKGKRKHAACDLLAPEGTPIYAVERGTILRHYDFYHGTRAVEIQHPNFVVRYGEIKKLAEGLGKGSDVEAGEVIAYVGRMHKDSMLHFEIYEGSMTGPLTNYSRAPYYRRADLMDPTPYLEKWRDSMLAACWGTDVPLW